VILDAATSVHKSAGFDWAWARLVEKKATSKRQHPCNREVEFIKIGFQSRVEAFIRVATYSTLSTDATISFESERMVHREIDFGFASGRKALYISIP
jgi:hypothetical protein